MPVPAALFHTYIYVRSLPACHLFLSYLFYICLPRIYDTIYAWRQALSERIGASSATRQQSVKARLLYIADDIGNIDVMAVDMLKAWPALTFGEAGVTSNAVLGYSDLTCDDVSGK